MDISLFAVGMIKGLNLAALAESKISVYTSLCWKALSFIFLNKIKITLNMIDGALYRPVRFL